MTGPKDASTPRATPSTACSTAFDNRVDGAVAWRSVRSQNRREGRGRDGNPRRRGADLGRDRGRRPPELGTLPAHRLPGRLRDSLSPPCSCSCSTPTSSRSTAMPLETLRRLRARERCSRPACPRCGVLSPRASSCSRNVRTAARAAFVGARVSRARRRDPASSCSSRCSSGASRWCRTSGVDTALLGGPRSPTP